MISRRLAAAVLAAALLAAACTAPDRTPEVLSATEVVTPTASPSEGPRPTPTPPPSPSQTPTPSPTAGTEDDAAVEAPEPSAGDDVTEAAIAAAVAQRRAELCVDPDAENGHDHQTYVLDGVIVVAVRCFTGAYQSEWTLVGYDEARGLYDLVFVEQWNSDLGGLMESPTVVGWFELDAEGRLLAVTLDRGIGDCGKVQRWYAQGDALFLARAAAQDCESADGTTHEQGWPTVYPSGD